jgi:hypothetical protein
MEISHLECVIDVIATKQPQKNSLLLRICSPYHFSLANIKHEQQIEHGIRLNIAKHEQQIEHCIRLNIASGQLL